MEKKKRVGIVGFGRMGMLHAGIVNALKGYQVTAIAEKSDFVTASLKVLAPNLKLYADYRQMLDKEDLSSVFITAPANVHVDMCLECCRRGIPFFVEAPLALNAPDAQRLVNALKEKPVVNRVGYRMRRIGTFGRARELFLSGILGETITFNISHYGARLFKKGKGRQDDNALSGGGLMMGPICHIVDQLVWFFGPAAGVNGYAINAHSEGVLDFIHAQFQMKSGVKGFLDSSWSVRGHWMAESRIEIHGTRGRLVVTEDNIRVFRDEAAGGLSKGWTLISKPEVFRHAEIDIAGPHYTLEDVEFLHGIAAGKPTESDAVSSFEVHKVISAFYESCEDHGNYKVVNA